MKEPELVADGFCENCATNVRVECGTVEAGDFRIVVTTLGCEKQELQLGGEPMVHLVKTLHSVMKEINPNWDPEAV